MRYFTRLLSGLLAIAVTASAAVLAMEVIATVAGRDTKLVVDWRRWESNLRAHAWGDAAVRWWGFGGAAAGLAAILFGLIARPSPLVRVLASPSSSTAVIDLDGRSLAHSLERTVRGVDGVVGARVRVRGSKVKVGVHTMRPRVGDIRDRVHEHVRERIASVSPDRTLNIDVEVSSRGFSS